MHLETLKTFCDLVETGSLSRAARLNLVSQSAVSQQLSALERRFGRRLIERAPRIGARATDAGRLLYDEVKPLLDLGMRLGEGSGAAVGVSVLRAALACHAGMATFAEAGVANKPR